MRFRFRRIASVLSAFGLLAAPAAVPGGGAQSAVQQQSGKQQAVAPVAQVPQAVIEIERGSFLGGSVRHPIWVGRAKHGKGRKFGGRSRWTIGAVERPIDMQGGAVWLNTSRP